MFLSLGQVSGLLATAGANERVNGTLSLDVIAGKGMPYAVEVTIGHAALEGCFVRVEFNSGSHDPILSLGLVIQPCLSTRIDKQDKATNVRNRLCRGIRIRCNRLSYSTRFLLRQ